MSALAETLAAYVPTLVLRRLEREHGRGRLGLERVRGAVMLSDISGFTALTERLSRRGAVGAEELSELLNRYFERLIGVVERHGGDVLKLAGDALLAFWPAEEEPAEVAALRAGQCALEVQSALGRYRVDAEAELSTKVGIGVGELAVMQVGGEFGRWELLITGDPLRQMSRAEQHAGPGEVILSPEAWALIGPTASGEPVESGCIRLGSITRPVEPSRSVAPRPHPDAIESLRGFLPAAIRSRIEAGQTGWLSELRRITVMFIGLPGVEPGDDEFARWQTIVRAIQSAVYRFEGSINKLSVDEKGLTLLAALGLPPFAHEDDAARAVRAALLIEQELKRLDYPCRIGLATGRIYCGEVGGRVRREYSLFGDTVNLAARLMQANRGILCDRNTYEDARGRVEFEVLPPIPIKGKTGEVPVYRAVGAAADAREARTLVGRTEELRRLRKALDDLGRGVGGVILIEGEAGIGKSHLVADWVEEARARSVNVLAGSGDAVERSTPYFAWRNVLAALLGFDEAEETDRRRARVLARLVETTGSDRLAPLLNLFLPLDLPENAATRELTGQVRADNIRDLVVAIVRAAVARGPTALVLEDAHWLDSASWALMTWVARELPRLLVVLTARPTPDGPRSERAPAELPGATVIRLDALDPADAIALALDRLGVDSLPAPVVALVERRAQGHPFFIEQLVLALRDAALIEVEGRTCKVAAGVDWDAVPFPDSVEGVVLARIDRLPPSQQLVLKVASVIGRLFLFQILRDIYPIEEERERLARELEGLERRNLTRLETSDPDLSYLFRHVILREVAYNLILFAQRRQLHREVATWYEATFGADIATHASLLSHHWKNAGDNAKSLAYLGKAGSQALRTGAYLEAIDFLDEALTIADRTEGDARPGPDDRARWHAWIGEANLALGRLPESRTHVGRALDLLGRPLPRSRAGLAARFVGELAVQARNRARRPRVADGGPAGSERSSLRIASACDHAYSQLCYYSQDVLGGVFAAVRSLNFAERCEPSAELARSYATMCVAAGLIPLRPLAAAYDRRAHEAAEAIGDREAIAWVSELTGIYWLGVGDWERARRNLDRAVAIAHEQGDWRRWEESVGELARLDFLTGDYPRAEEQFRRMGDVADHRDHEQARIWSRHGRATVLLRLGRTEEAAALLEASPVLRPDAAVDRSDAILGLGLLALARLRLGRDGPALQAAEAALERMGATRPIVNYSLEGYAGAAEALLALWERAQRSPAGDGASLRSLRRHALRACAALDRFAAVFPNGSARARILRGRADWIAGRPRRARSRWAGALRLAERQSLPLDQALAHAWLATVEGDDPREGRSQHAERARAILTRLGAVTELEQTRERP